MPMDYKDYHGKPAKIKERAKRNKARATMVKAGKVKKGDGKEIDHKDGNPNNNSRKNLRVTSRHTNRVKQ
jgi:hypothetical protein